jgi:hypothetical protein
MTRIEVLHDCGCIGPRTNLRAKVTCPVHGRCEAVGVRMLRDALSRSAPAPWTKEAPRPSDPKEPR